MAATYRVERSADIAAPPSAVYAQLVDFHRWEAWSPWADIDPDQTETYTGPDSGVGAHYTWSGNRKVGEGSMQILEADPDERVVIDLSFLRPFKSRSTTAFALAPTATGTRVTWTMEGPNTGMTKVFTLFKSMDSMIGPDFEKGLTRLRATVES